MNLRSRLVLAAIRRHLGPKSHSPITYAQIEALCGVQRATARRALKDLRAVGLIKLTPSAGGAYTVRLIGDAVTELSQVGGV